jgi:predicted O-linked N-acetylglucosamine transferase (SPINDLY family)
MAVPEGETRDTLLRDVAGGDIDPQRITLMPRVSIPEYFRCFNEVDIALDTTPYSGGTTTCDAIWMGVPVLTLSGTRSVSRSTASILSVVGLQEWIAQSPAEYVRKASRFAADVSLLHELRSALRSRMQHSPLMDEERFTRDMERAYRAMWQAWCAGGHV